MSIWHFPPLHRIKAREAKTEQNKNKLLCPLCNAWRTSQVRSSSRCLYFGNIPSTTVRNQHHSFQVTKDYRAWIHPPQGLFFFLLTWAGEVYSPCAKPLTILEIITNLWSINGSTQKEKEKIIKENRSLVEYLFFSMWSGYRLSCSKMLTSLHSWQPKWALWVLSPFYGI